MSTVVVTEEGVAERARPDSPQVLVVVEARYRLADSGGVHPIFMRWTVLRTVSVGGRSLSPCRNHLGGCSV